MSKGLETLHPSGFEPRIFCPGSGRDDHYGTAPWHVCYVTIFYSTGLLSKTERGLMVRGPLCGGPKKKRSKTDKTCLLQLALSRKSPRRFARLQCRTARPDNCRENRRSRHSRFMSVSKTKYQSYFNYFLRFS
jgi:hypothetical protein